MENILVTGGCGFIGSNFIHFLLSDADFSGRIINVDKMTYAANPDNLKSVETDHPDRYNFVKADICDSRAMAEIFAGHHIDTICHFAAESHVDRSIVAPDAFIQTNIVGTQKLLELARQHPEQIALFHHVSTDEVYGSLTSTGYFTESTPYDPSSPYAASKAASDHLVSAYHRTYGLPVTISNCSNNYGPYQFPEKLIPLMILNAMAGKELPVYGDGKNVRDWLYVTDHCRAIWQIMKNGRRGQTYNIGGNAEKENIDVVRMICDQIDEIHTPLADGRPRRELIRFIKDRPGHDRRYAMDFTKLRKELQWEPAESFETGMAQTIAWYIDNREWVERVQTGEYLSWIESHYAS